MKGKTSVKFKKKKTSITKEEACKKLKNRSTENNNKMELNQR